MRIYICYALLQQAITGTIYDYIEEKNIQIA